MTRVVIATVLLALLAACGTTDQPRTDPDLTDLPGVRDAALHRVALDTDYYGYHGVVDMEPDATPDQIAAVLDELARWKRTRDADEVTTAVLLGAGTTELYDAAWLDGTAAGIGRVRDHAGNRADADLLVRATQQLGLPVTIEEGEWDVVTPTVRETAAVIATHPDLAAVPDLVVRRAYPPPDTDWWDRTGSLGASPRLTPELLAAYDRVVDSTRLVADGDAAVLFAGNPSRRALGEEYDDAGNVVEPPAGTFQVQVDVRLPDGAGPSTRQPRLADDPLWPMVRAQLDLLRGQPTGSHLWITLRFTRPGGIPYDGSRSLVEVTRGKDVPKGARTPWNLEASAYLNR
jgi:dienelactone hydrolase